MKKFLTLFFLLFGFTYLSAAAEDAVLWVDYCDGKKASSGQKISSTGAIELAIKFSAADMAGFSNNEIRRVSVGWPSGNPGGDITVWVREEASGANLAKATTKAASGWQEVTLDAPYPITGEKDVWVGVTYNQSSTRTGYVSLAGETHEDGSYYRVGDGEWESFASLNKGSMAIRMGVGGDYLPKHDLKLSDLSVPRNIYPVGGEVPVSGVITNNATDECVNPIIRASVNGQVVKDFTINATIPFTKAQTFTVEVPTDVVSEPTEGNIQLEVLWADGVEDSKPADNVATTKVDIVTPVRDLTLVGAGAGASVYKFGSAATVYGSIKNSNYVVAKNPQLKFYIGGELVHTYTISATLDYGQLASYTVQVPTTSVKEEGKISIDVELVWADGVEDSTPADNKKTVTGITLSKSLIVRKMVIEEGTGTWCGWCIRGIVGMSEMKKQYPDRFVGIAVHVSDEFENSTYANWIVYDAGVDGFPGCVINRDGTVYDPNYSKMNSYMKSLLNATADAEVVAEGGISGSEVLMKATVTPSADLENRDLKVVFVITEDDVTATQSNYYSGGGSGAMGGFENEASKVTIGLNDVARGIYPSPTGDKTVALPSNLKKGTPYEIGYTVKLSDVKAKKAENLLVSALLLDSKTGQILNADQQPFSDVSGIGTVLAPESEDAPVYNLAGQRINANAKGIVIQNGKKMIRR